MSDSVSPAARSRIMSRIRGRDTKPEKLVRSALHREGFRFRLHARELPGRPDLVLPRYRVAINVNGCFWHSHHCRAGKRPASNTAYWNRKLARNKTRDFANRKLLRRLGWRVFVVWECQIGQDVQRVRNALTGLRSPRGGPS